MKKILVGLVLTVFCLSMSAVFAAKGEFSPGRTPAERAPETRRAVPSTTTTLPRLAPREIEIDSTLPESYSFVNSWRYGSFMGATIGIAIGPDGNVYYEANSFVHKFDPDGNFISRFGGFGRDDEQLAHVYDLAFGPDGNLYIGQLNAIKKFTADGDFISEWDSDWRESGGWLDGAESIAVDSRGFVYALIGTTIMDHTINKYDSDGNHITSWAIHDPLRREHGAYKISPTCLAVDPISGNILLAVNVELWTESVSYGGSIFKYSPDGEYLGEYKITELPNVGGTVWGSGQSAAIYGIEIDAAGNIFVAGTENNKVYKFDSSRRLLAKWGSEGSGDGQFDRPIGIAVNLTGDVYVTDFGNARVCKFRKVRLGELRMPTVRPTTTTTLPMMRMDMGLPTTTTTATTLRPMKFDSRRFR